MQTDSDRVPIAQAAAAVGIGLGELSASEHPWASQHPKAGMWRMAVASMAPAVAERYEVANGGELSMGLQMALDGQAEMTPQLMGEWQQRRPEQYRAHKEAAIARAIAELNDRTQAAIEANQPSFAQRQAAEAERQRAAQQSLAMVNAQQLAQHRATHGW